MSIEIKELHIRVEVNTLNDRNGACSVGSDSNMNLDKGGKDVLVAECIEQVMQILQNKQER